MCGPYPLRWTPGLAARFVGRARNGFDSRSFTPEYKAQSVAFVIDGGRPVAEVARNIGVHEMTLGKWVKVARDAAESGKNPDAPLGESERAELARLRAESRDDKSTIAELRMQVELAKKVGTWFAKGSQ
ncbi:MAG TPA: transposase [Streptosporangiaceae bacterium]